MYKDMYLDTELVGRKQLCLQRQIPRENVTQNKDSSAEGQICTSFGLSAWPDLATENNESCF